MNEIERRSYLGAMGVEVFYLKQSLARAKRSPNYLFPEEAEGGVGVSNELLNPGVGISSDNKLAKENTRSELAKIRLGLNPTTAQKTETGFEPAAAPVEAAAQVRGPRQEDVAPSIIEDSSPSVGDLQFKLHYFVLNDKVAILDEQPYAQTGKPDRDRLDLLRNILTALNVDYSQCDFRADTITWPLETEMEFDELPDKAAEQMLRGFIAQKYQSHGFQYLLVFAGSLESLLEKGKESVESGFSMIITSSLSAMLAYPELKRQVWQQLKPLIPTLAKP